MIGDLRLLNLGFVLVTVLVGTILHEAGHAVAGALVGYRIFRIEIGKGKPFLEFKWAGLRWRFRDILFGGIAIGCPRSREWYRVKQSIYILGGPTMNALLALMSWNLLWLDSSLGSTALAGFEPMGIILLSNCLLLLGSVLPHRANTVHGKLPNDALLLWQTWRTGNGKIEDALAARYLLEAEDCRQDGKLMDARHWLAEGLHLFPGNRALAFSTATYPIFEHKLDEARKLLLGLMVQLADDARLFPLVLNNIAYADALLGDPQLLPEADEFSRRALEKMPGLVYFKGTRGIVLVELGQYKEGVALLKAALRTHPEKSGRAINACYLGIAASRNGQTSQSVSYFTLARKLDPKCPLLSREAKADAALAR